MPLAMEEIRTAWLKLKSYVDDLTHERQHYVDFFERAEAAYLVTDAHGTIVEANGAAVDLLDRRRRQLIGKPIVTLVSAAERRRFRDRLPRLARAADRWRGDLHSRGRLLAVELSARPIPGQGICWALRPAE